MSLSKPNQASIVTIEHIDDEQIKLNLNGQILEIRNQLANLQELVQEAQANRIQYADKIYNIEHINEANFGFLTGNKAFNQNDEASSYLRYYHPLIFCGFSHRWCERFRLDRGLLRRGNPGRCLRRLPGLQSGQLRPLHGPP